MRRTSFHLLLAGLPTLVVAATPPPPFPADPQALRGFVSFHAMETWLRGLARPGFLTVTEMGRSTQGRPLLAVRLCRGGDRARFRVLLYAQQHGDEPAGRHALLHLIRRYVEHPDSLPEEVDLTLVPAVNPDGGEAFTRVNGVGADLNRDHLRLAQPETRALYRLARQVMPHLAVDCHEFSRDPEDWRSRGLIRWPLVTLDAMSHPLIPAPLRALALGRVQSAHAPLQAAGIPFARYMVGGPPPDEEMRPSTPEVDDGRNGMGSHGALSFIIESGIRHQSPDPQADLGARVRAVLQVLDHLLGDAPWRDQVVREVDALRHASLPSFLPANTFWAATPGAVTPVKVLDLATGEPRDMPSAEVCTTLVVKRHVPTPRAYAIDPAAAAAFRPVLEGHGLRYTVLGEPWTQPAETCRLDRFEAPEDPVYHRHPDRTLVSRGPRRDTPLPAGTLVVPLDQPLARRAVQVLEPTLLYGLYSYDDFRALAAPDGTLPVRRLF